MAEFEFCKTVKNMDGKFHKLNLKNASALKLPKSYFTLIFAADLLAELLGVFTFSL